jgi:hypothetical protein
VHSSRSFVMKGTLARTKFMLPAIGLDHHAGDAAAVQGEGLFQLATLLYSSTSVCCTTSGGTPALVGWPKVARPEPALTSSASAWPW